MKGKYEKRTRDSNRTKKVWKRWKWEESKANREAYRKEQYEQKKTQSLILIFLVGGQNFQLDKIPLLKVLTSQRLVEVSLLPRQRWRKTAQNATLITGANWKQSPQWLSVSTQIPPKQMRRDFSRKIRSHRQTGDEIVGNASKPCALL